MRHRRFRRAVLVMAITSALLVTLAPTRRAAAATCTGSAWDIATCQMDSYVFTPIRIAAEFVTKLQELHDLFNPGRSLEDVRQEIINTVREIQYQECIDLVESKVNSFKSLLVSYDPNYPQLWDTNAYTWKVAANDALSKCGNIVKNSTAWAAYMVIKPYNTLTRMLAVIEKRRALGPASIDPITTAYANAIEVNNSILNGAAGNRMWRCAVLPGDVDGCGQLRGRQDLYASIRDYVWRQNQPMSRYVDRNHDDSWVKIKGHGDMCLFASGGAGTRASMVGCSASDEGTYWKVAHMERTRVRLWHSSDLCLKHDLTLGSCWGSDVVWGTNTDTPQNQFYVASSSMHVVLWSWLNLLTTHNLTLNPHNLPPGEGLSTTIPAGELEPRHRSFIGYQDFGGSFTGPLTALAPRTDRLVFFGRGNSGTVAYKTWSPEGGWSVYSGIPNSPVIPEGSRVAAVASKPGRVDVVVRTASNRYAYTYSLDDGETYSNWIELPGGYSSDPAMTSWGPGRIDLFGRGNSGGIYHLYNNGGTSFAGPIYRGGASRFRADSLPSVVSWGAGRLDIFTRGDDDAVHHLSYPGWSWQSLGGVITSDPKATTWGVNRLDVFARGQSGNAFHIHSPSGGQSWSVWQSLTPIQLPPGAAPIAIARPNNSLEVYARNSAKYMFKLFWDPKTQQWSGWELVGGHVQAQDDASVATWCRHRADLITRSMSNRLLFTYAQDISEGWLTQY